MEAGAPAHSGVSPAAPLPVACVFKKTVCVDDKWQPLGLPACWPDAPQVVPMASAAFWHAVGSSIRVEPEGQALLPAAPVMYGTARTAKC